MTNYPNDPLFDQWICEVVRNDSIEPIQKLCAIQIATVHTCKGTGMTFAPVELIAKEAEVSKETVKRAIEQLQGEGLLHLIGVVGKPGEKVYGL